MDKNELTNWALAIGWQMIAGCPSLTRPSSPTDPIVRMVFKATVVNLEVKLPVGRWEKVSGESYAKINLDPDTDRAGARVRHHFRISGFTKLMEDNKNRLVFAKLAGPSKFV